MGRYHQVPKEWGVARNGLKKPTDGGLIYCVFRAACLPNGTSISIDASTSLKIPGSNRSLIFKR